jgi:hypothetical protein
MYKDEVFKYIDWYNWEYQISNLWRVKSLKYWKERIFSPWRDWKWYLQVSLRFNWIEKKIKVHKLVLEAFNCKKPYWLECNHIDWNKENNNIINLEWVTKSKNQLHRCHILWKASNNLKTLMKGKFWKDNHLSKKVNQYDLNWNIIKNWDSFSDIERELWFFHWNIWKVCKNIYKQAYWFIWKYV